VCLCVCVYVCVCVCVCMCSWAGEGKEQDSKVALYCFFALAYTVLNGADALAVGGFLLPSFLPSSSPPLSLSLSLT
jgi:hypothetical protein